MGCTWTRRHPLQNVVAFLERLRHTFINPNAWHQCRLDERYSASSYTSSLVAKSTRQPRRTRLFDALAALPEGIVISSRIPRGVDVSADQR